MLISSDVLMFLCPLQWGEKVEGREKEQYSSSTVNAVVASHCDMLPAFTFLRLPPTKLVYQACLSSLSILCSTALQFLCMVLFFSPDVPREIDAGWDNNICQSDDALLFYPSQIPWQQSAEVIMLHSHSQHSQSSILNPQSPNLQYLLLQTIHTAETFHKYCNSWCRDSDTGTRSYYRLPLAVFCYFLTEDFTKQLIPCPACIHLLQNMSAFLPLTLYPTLHPPYLAPYLYNYPPAIRQP